MTKEAIAELKKKIQGDKDLQKKVAGIRQAAIDGMAKIADAKGLRVCKDGDADGLLALLSAGGATDGALSLDDMASLSGGGDTGGGTGFGGGGGGTGGSGGTTGGV